MKKALSILAFLFYLSMLSAQEENLVSMIGDNEENHEAAIMACPSTLLEITGNDMQKAYTLWSEMLLEMESMASAEGLDLKGLKLWINVFWQTDGKIKKVIYYPKPNCKNMDFEVLTIFLEKFSIQYTLPVGSELCFSHNGSASFPVYSKLRVHDAK